MHLEVSAWPSVQAKLVNNSFKAGAGGPLWHNSLETVKLKQVDGASLEISEESSNWTVCVTHRK